MSVREELEIELNRLLPIWYGQCQLPGERDMSVLCADFILAREQRLRDEVKEWKDKYNKLNHELMCELRDPCGTIWEHAKKQQDKMDEMKASHLKVLEAIKRHLDKHDLGHPFSIASIQEIITAEIGKKEELK